MQHRWLHLSCIAHNFLFFFSRMRDQTEILLKHLYQRFLFTSDFPQFCHNSSCSVKSPAVQKTLWCTHCSAAAVLKRLTSTRLLLLGWHSEPRSRFLGGKLLGIRVNLSPKNTCASERVKDGGWEIFQQQGFAGYGAVLYWLAATALGMIVWKMVGGTKKRVDCCSSSTSVSGDEYWLSWVV